MSKIWNTDTDLWEGVIPSFNNGGIVIIRYPIP